MKKRILITGGTGLIGSNISQRLIESDYDVIVLTRNRQKVSSVDSEIHFVQWDPENIDIWKEYVNGAHAIVNLAGESLDALRWTKKKKQRILQSRLDVGQAICEAIRAVDQKPSVLIQASGIGYYGDRNDEILNESSTIGEGFLPGIARQWESAVSEASSLGTRLVYIRTGVVLARDGGFLKRVLLPFRFWVGGHFGKGDNWLSWIHIEDEIRAIQFLIEHSSLSGSFNLCAPNLVVSKEFFKILGKVIKRPSWLPVPEFILKFALGEVAQELVFVSQRAVPDRLLKNGFRFKYTELKLALENIFR